MIEPTSLNQKRQRGYHWLTNAILTCPSYKTELLQANPDLLDAGLIKTMLEVAEMHEQGGDQNSANWLRNIATQLADRIDGSLSAILKQAEADKLLWKGMELQRTGDFKTSLQFLQSALNIYQEIENLQGEWLALNALGKADDFFGQYQKAIDKYDQALFIARRTKNLGGEACCLGNLGKAYCSLGNYHRAIDYQQQVLNITDNTVQEIEDRNSARHAAATALGNLGTNYYYLGQYKKAIDCHQKQLDLAREIRNKIEEINALGGLGLVFYFIGQTQKSIDYYQQSLAIAREVDARAEEASSLSNLGAAYNLLGENNEAIECFQKALQIQREQGNRTSEAGSQSGLGLVYRSMEHYPQAIKHYQQALETARETEDRSGEANYLSNLGLICNLLGQYQQATDYCNQALTITKEIGDRRGEAFALDNLGQALLNSGQLTRAESTFYAAVEVKEFLRIGLKDAHKVSIFDTQVDTYSLLQQAIVLQRRPNEALEIAERGRARAFAELLYERSPDLTGVIDSDLVEKELIESPTLKQIQQIAQKQKVAIVEYSIVNLDHLFIWVILPTDEITFCPVHLKPLRQQNTSLAGLVTDARNCLSSNGPIYQPLQQLYEYLIQPIVHLLPINPNIPIAFIPQGALFLVPFSALQDATGEFLLKRHTILIAPSIQVLELTHKQEEAKSRQRRAEENLLNALVVGNPTMPTVPLTDPPIQLPDLKWAEIEANAIATLLSTKAITGKSATKVAIREQMFKARLIHLATHGLLEDIRQLGVPGAIALAPSEDDIGFLTAGEILEMNLNAELVVLSACSTGQGKVTGDGVIGLTRSLLAAGVPSVIVSLWSVDDRSTALLMIQFYQYLQKGMKSAIALSEAQRWLMSTTKSDMQAWIDVNQNVLSPTLRISIMRELNQLSDNERLFLHPHHWAAFCEIGQ